MDDLTSAVRNYLPAMAMLSAAVILVSTAQCSGPQADAARAASAAVLDQRDLVCAAADDEHRAVCMRAAALADAIRAAEAAAAAAVASAASSAPSPSPTPAAGGAAPVTLTPAGSGGAG